MMDAFLDRSLGCVFGNNTQSSCPEEAKDLIGQLTLLLADPLTYKAEFPNTDSDVLQEMYVVLRG